MAWIKGSADRGTRHVPQTENLDEDRRHYDSEERVYYADSFNDDISYAGYKKHPVMHSTVSLTREVTRDLTLYDSGRFILIAGSLSQVDLDPDPRAYAEVRGDSKNHNRPTLDRFSVDTDDN